MAVREWIKGTWVALAVTLIFALVFLSFSILSAMTYSQVVVAQQKIVLENPVRSASVLTNGTVKIEFSVSVVNPSGYVIHITTLSWYTHIENSTGTPRIITLANELFSENSALTISAKETKNYVFDAYISDRSVLTALKGYVNFSNAQGHDITLATAPYSHSFDIRGWLDDFKHDYFREEYLNQLVDIDLPYTYPEVSG